MAPDIQTVTSFRTVGADVARRTVEAGPENSVASHVYLLFSSINNYIRSQLDTSMLRRAGLTHVEPELHCFDALDRLANSGFRFRISPIRQLPRPSSFAVIADYEVINGDGLPPRGIDPIVRFKFAKDNDGFYTLWGNADSELKPILGAISNNVESVAQNYEQIATQVLLHIDGTVENFLRERVQMPRPAAVPLRAVAG